MTLTATNNPSPMGRAGYIRATLAHTGSGTAPTGTVTFYDDGSELAQVPITFDLLVLPLQGLAVGTHAITAVYSGDQTHSATNAKPLTEKITAPAPAGPTNLADATSAIWALAQNDWSAASQSVPPGSYPQESRTPTSWNYTKNTAWTAGYFPGAVLLSAAQQGPDALHAAHTTLGPWLAGLTSEDTDDTTQDLGLMLTSSLLTDEQLTGDPDDAQALLTGARTLASRYDATTGVLPSWHHTAGTIGTETDQIPGLMLLLWAADHGGTSTEGTIALSAADHAARDLVRPDGSTWHYANYDPSTGELASQSQNKGVGDLVWARGQAWAIEGFAETYAATGDPALLTAARATAAYWIANVPAGEVPYDYFGNPAAPDAQTDTSAAAIAARGLLELAAVDPDPADATADRDLADSTIVALAGPTYLGGTAGLLTDAQGAQTPTDYDSDAIWGDYALEQALTTGT